MVVGVKMNRFMKKQKHSLRSLRLKNDHRTV